MGTVLEELTLLNSQMAALVDAVTVSKSLIDSAVPSAQTAVTNAALTEADRIVTEAAAVIAEAARDAAQAARDIAAGYASDAVSQGNVPIYATAAGISDLTIPLGINALRTNGFRAAGDLGGALYKRVMSEPAHAAKIQDSSGAWFELASFLVTPEMFGAYGDYSHDDRAALNLALVFLNLRGGGKLDLGDGVYGVSGPVFTFSNVWIDGKGWTKSGIRALPDAVFTDQQGVVMSSGFVSDANLWNYYVPYPAGLQMAVKLTNFFIDGNRAAVANANGLMIYGGKWSMDFLAVISTAGHAIWTECGHPVSSTMGDDTHDYLNMHESHAGTVFICNANKHGWWYRGPNDSIIDNLQIKTCKWGAFYQDSGDAIATGGLKIAQLHAYACDCDHESGYMIELAYAQVDRVYTDTSFKGGLNLVGACQVNQILSFKNNPNGEGDFFAVRVAVRSSIGQIRITSNVATTEGSDGGGVHILPAAERTLIGTISSTAHSGSTVPAIGLKIEATGVNVLSAALFGYTTGLELSSSQCRIFGQIVSSEVGLDYKNTAKGRNDLRLTFDGCDVDYETEQRFATSDLIAFASDKYTYPLSALGDVQLDHLNMPREARSIVGETTFTIDASRSSVQTFNLGGQLTLSAPINAEEGDILKLLFFQNSPGGNNVVFNPIFLHNFSNTGNTTAKRSSINFIFNGTQWVQDGGFSGWY